MIDEVGYQPLERAEANLVFQVISKRYEKGSIILTSNKTFGEWGQVFGDEVLATAILDRLLHHCDVISINGPSYRLKNRLTAIERPSQRRLTWPRSSVPTWGRTLVRRQAPILADLLGVAPKTAVRWAKAVNTDWTHYLAARSETSSPPTSTNVEFRLASTGATSR